MTIATQEHLKPANELAGRNASRFPNESSEYRLAAVVLPGGEGWRVLRVFRGGAGRRVSRSPQPGVHDAPLRCRQGHYACGVPPCLRLRGENAGTVCAEDTDGEKNVIHQTSRSRARIRLWRLWTLRLMGANPLD